MCCSSGPPAGTFIPSDLSPNTTVFPLLLERSHERDQVRPLRGRQTRLQHKVEKLHGVFQRQQSPMVEVWRLVLDAPQGKRFDGIVG